jgi:hypothetical protein
LEVSSLKVVQGLEAEFTNKFFIALAEAACDNNLDKAEAVRLCLAGQLPGIEPPYRRVSGKHLSMISY